MNKVKYLIKVLRNKKGIYSLEYIKYIQEDKYKKKVLYSFSYI